MKNTTLALALLCSLAFSSARAQHGSADSLVKGLFTALQQKDEQAYVALYPNKDQMLRIMTNMITAIAAEIQKADTTRQNKQEMDMAPMILEALKRKATETEVTKMNEGFARGFRQFVADGERRGINWSKTRLVRYSCDSTSVSDKGAQAMFGGDGMKTLQGLVVFAQGDSTYQFVFDQVMYLPEAAGWYGARLRHLGKEGEGIVEEREVEITDVNVNMEGEDNPPPPPPPAKKKAVKKPVKAPAKKPVASPKKTA